MNHRVFVASLMISAVLPFATATLTFTVQPADAVVVVGQSLMLNCQATDSTGTPVTINWKKGSDWLVDPTNKPWRQLRNNSLYYTSIAAQDVGEFLCGAVSGGSAIIYSRTVTVELASISSIFVSNPNNRTKRVGDADTHFACVTGISKPFASVYWEKDGVKLTEYPTTSMLIPTDNPSWTSASISVRNITLKSAGFYRCVAVNPMLPNLPKKSQPAYLQVLPAIDAPHFQVHPSSTTIAELQSAALQCHILGVPTPSVTWEFNSNGLLDSPDRYQLSNGSLYFKSANRTMAGVYKCTGTNSVGSVSSSPVFVGVAYFDFVFHKHPSSQNVTEGAPVSLECDPPNSYPIGVAITWFRNYQVVQLGSGITVSSSGTLTFATAKKADEGEYFCSVVNSYLHASRSSSIALLTVWVRPTFSTKPQNTTVIEHQSLLLICAATGYPMPSVLWLKDNQAVDTNHVTLHSNGSLSITRVLFSDRGSYSCVATNVAGSASSVATLTVQVPPTVSGRPTNATRIVGESHTVTCQFQGSPAPLVTWFFKNDTADQTVPSTLNYIINGGILTIKAVTKSDEGTFVCKGTNPAGAAEASANLYVKVPVFLDAGPVNVTVNETSTASFECQASGDPTPTVTWYRGQTALTHGGRYVIGQGTLTILRSNPSDTGEYRCNVTNGLATHVGVAHLFVQVPAAITSFTAPRFAQLNGSTTLICLTRGIPSPRITWYRDRRVVTPDGSRVTINGGSLSIARVTRSDGGTYACAASNAAGMTSRTANLTIQVPPDPPTDVSALPLTSTSIKLSWKPAFNGHSPVTSYTIEQRVGDRYQEIASGVTMTAYTVSGLSPYVEYTFRLRAMNAIGLGEGGLVSNTTMEDAPSEPRNVAVTSLNSTTITVTWSAPATPNGIITWYEITYMVKGGSSSSQQFPVSGLPQLRVVISNLLPHRLYVVRVRAATGSGAKMWGNFSSEAEGMTGEDTPSAPPQAVRVRASNATAIHVTWQAVPASSTNGILRGYQILYQAVGPFHYGSPMTMTSLTMNASLDGLHPWTDYQVSVQAFTVGAGPASPGIIVRTHESVPSGPPLNVTLVTADANSINVSMASPAPIMRNGNITGFRVYYKESNSSGPFSTVTTDSMETRLVNLTTYMEYAVSVAAMTTSGEGVRSQAMTVRTGEGVPGEVRDVTLEDKTHVSVKVTWNPPQPSTGIIQEYRIVYNTSEGGLKSKTTSDTSVVLTNMVPNTTYALWVVAKTSAGYGPRGSTLYLTTGLPPVPSTSAPPAPTTATPNATKSPAVGSGPSPSRLLSERDLIIVVSCIGVIVILLILLAVYFIVIRPRNSYKGQMSGTERKRRQGAIDMENLRGVSPDKRPVLDVHEETTSNNDDSFDDGSEWASTITGMPSEPASEPIAVVLPTSATPHLQPRVTQLASRQPSETLPVNSRNEYDGETTGGDRSPLTALRNKKLSMDSLEGSVYDQPYTSVDELGPGFSSFTPPPPPDFRSDPDFGYAPLNDDTSPDRKSFTNQLYNAMNDDQPNETLSDQGFSEVSSPEVRSPEPEETPPEPEIIIPAPDFEGFANDGYDTDEELDKYLGENEAPAKNPVSEVPIIPKTKTRVSPTELFRGLEANCPPDPPRTSPPKIPPAYPPRSSSTSLSSRSSPRDSVKVSATGSPVPPAGSPAPSAGLPASDVIYAQVDKSKKKRKSTSSEPGHVVYDERTNF